MPYLQDNYGDILEDNFNDIYNLYRSYITCVCFMGEGKGTQREKKEFRSYCNILHQDNIKTALYCGRDCNIEKWMNIFDYVKVGSYQEARGPLTSKTTNQVLYKKVNENYKNITYLFWR